MITTLFISCIFLLISIVICIYIIFNLLKKYESLETKQETQQIWIYNFKQTVDFLNNRLKQIDIKGSFEADDEVGIFFKELKKMQEVLNQYFILEKEEDDSIK